MSIQRTRAHRRIQLRSHAKRQRQAEPRQRSQEHRQFHLRGHLHPKYRGLPHHLYPDQQR